MAPLGKPVRIIIAEPIKIDRPEREIPIPELVPELVPAGK